MSRRRCPPGAGPSGPRRVGGWLLLAGAVLLLVSLALTWSRQFPPGVLRVPGIRVALAGVPRDANAWEVYSVADVLLAALAVTLAATALAGAGRGRWLVAVALGVAAAFVAHALSVPPTSGVDVVLPGGARSLRSLAATGPGEVVALVALGLAGAGLCLSSIRVRHHR